VAVTPSVREWAIPLVIRHMRLYAAYGHSRVQAADRTPLSMLARAARIFEIIGAAGAAGRATEVCRRLDPDRPIRPTVVQPVDRHVGTAAERIYWKPLR
jgi:hypothetical protein